jgi:formamidopyrimidine-DNA glycosylase
MPELPEVQLVASHLERLVTGQSIVAASLLRERLAPSHSPENFADLLTGSTLIRVRRRGKFLLIELDSGHTLLVHLRMSGRFMLLTEDIADPKFTHCVLYFSDQSRLVFTDQRHFGYMRVVNSTKLETAPEIAKLAPEPFSQEFSCAYMIKVLSRSKRAVKELLLDQTKVCGLGNIYASEALFRAGISPQTRADSISKTRTEQLHLSIRKVLTESIELSKIIKLDPANIGGNFYGAGSDSTWHVYGREDEPCTVCRSKIKRLKQGGRSTFYCPRCQK